MSAASINPASFANSVVMICRGEMLEKVSLRSLDPVTTTSSTLAWGADEASSAAVATIADSSMTGLFPFSCALALFKPAQASATVTASKFLWALNRIVNPPRVRVFFATSA